MSSMEKLDKKVEELEQQIEETSFATMLLKDFKAQNKRLFIVILILIFSLIFTNGLWIYSWCQYDYVDETVTEQVIENIDSIQNSNITNGR